MVRLLSLMRASISVVIPAYNSEKTVEAAVLSVLSQTEPPEEVIVVDDGSADKTPFVVKKFGGKVRLLCQANQGSAVARQAGTELATSDYIAYLDADDWWPVGKVARYRKIIANEDIDCMFADLQRAKPGDAPENYLPRNFTFFPWAREYFKGCAVNLVENLYKLEQANGLSLLLHGFPMYPSTLLVKRSVIEGVGGWDGRFRRCQDFDIVLRIARRFPLHYLDEVTAIIGIHEVNESAYPYVVKQTEGDIKVLSAHLEPEPLGSAYHRQLAEALGRKHCGLGYAHRSVGQYELARKSYRNAIGCKGCRMHALIRWAIISILCLTRRGKQVQ